MLVIGPDGILVSCSQANQTNVAGVYSTSPGFVGGASEEDAEGNIPLAMVGVVPVKVSGENGAIQC